MAFIPGGENEEDARRKTCLNNTDKDAENDEVLEVVDDCHHASEAAPETHEKREIVRRPGSDEDHIGRWFEDNITDYSWVRHVLLQKASGIELRVGKETY